MKRDSLNILGLDLGEEIFKDPKNIVESYWFQHIPFLNWLLVRCNPVTFLEMGVQYGMSYFVVCEYFKQHPLGRKSFALDNWVGDVNTQLYDSSVYDLFSTLNEQYSDFSFPMVGDFKDGLKKIEDNSIELAHIDGCHTYQAVNEDFNNLKGNMRNNGIILFHDINEYQINFGAYRFWREIEEEYETFSFMHGHGLGVLKLNSSIPTPIDKLFNLESIEKIFFQDLFKTLGERLEFKIKLERSWQDISNLNKIITEQRNSNKFSLRKFI